MKRGLLLTPLLLALVACGGGDSDPAAEATGSPSASKTSQSPTETASAAEDVAAPEDELEDAFRAYVGALMTGDGATAYGLLSGRCREATPLSGFALGAESAAEIYGEVDYTIDSVTVDGDEGHVDATYAVEALNNDDGGSLWVLEDGEWRSDKCD